MCAVNKNSLTMQKKFRFKKHLDIDGYYCLTVMLVSDSVFADLSIPLHSLKEQS